MSKLLLKITNLHCPACVMRLEGIEDDLTGISSAKASYVSQTMEIIYDESVLKPERILEAIRELGYTPTPTA